MEREADSVDNISTTPKPATAEVLTPIPETKKEAVPAAAAPPRPPQFVSVKVLIQAVLFVSLAMSIMSLVVYDRFFAVKVASFDLPAFLLQIKTARAENKISDEQAGKLVDGVRAQIDALPPNYVVITGDVILGNAIRVKKITSDLH